MALIDKKVGEFSLGQAFVVGISKSLLEQVHAPVVGNGNFVSGGVKLVEGYLVSRYVKNDLGKNIATALVVDSVEDILNALFMGGSKVESTSSGLI